jgi:PAP2 superfamily
MNTSRKRKPGTFAVAPRLGGTIFASSLLLFGLWTARADPVTEWNTIMQATAAATAPLDPALRGRTAAITQVAVFEAVNSIIEDYEPYHARIPGPPSAMPEAAAVAAAHRALVALHPESTASLDAARAKSLAAISDGSAKNDGIAVGVAAADAILGLRADDGFDKAVPYTPGTNPGDWQPTPPDFLPAFRPGLGQVATFGIQRAAQFRTEPPPPIQSRKYARDYNDVKEVGAVNSTERPADRTDVARFSEVTDADGFYYPAARQVTMAQGKTLSQNARIFALLAMAIWDGAVACFESKYHFNYWRPVTAIRAGETDGNAKTEPDFDWQPLIFTPPFPSYPSGHASFGAAARVILEQAFGEDGHSIKLTNPKLPEIVLHYTSFKQITDDIDDGRVFGGVHFWFDQEAGARQGKRIGEYILRHKLRPVRDKDL